MTKLLQFLKSPEFTFGVHDFTLLAQGITRLVHKWQRHENSQIIQVLY